MMSLSTFTKGGLAALLLASLVACSKNPPAASLATSRASAATASTPAKGTTTMGNTVTTASGLQYIDQQVGTGVEAKSGQRDDLVMALILALRMVEFVSTWDDGSHSAVNSNILDDGDAYDHPMPIFI